MKRLIRWPLGEEIVTVHKKEIMEILFHRGRMLLLDLVVINEGDVIGEFVVPACNCEGHEPMPKMPLMRGVEVIEMAFQLLGILTAKNPVMADFSKDKTAVAREVNGVKFSGFIKPGNNVVLQTSTEVTIEEVGGVMRIESGRIVASVDGQKKATIGSVAIAAFDRAQAARKVID